MDNGVVTVRKLALAPSDPVKDFTPQAVINVGFDVQCTAVHNNDSLAGSRRCNSNEGVFNRKLHVHQFGFVLQQPFAGLHARKLTPWHITLVKYVKS